MEMEMVLGIGLLCGCGDGHTGVCIALSVSLGTWWHTERMLARWFEHGAVPGIALCVGWGMGLVVLWFPNGVVAGDGASWDTGCASRLFNGNEAVRESERGIGGEDRAGSGVMREHTAGTVTTRTAKCSCLAPTEFGVCRRR